MVNKILIIILIIDIVMSVYKISLDKKSNKDVRIEDIPELLDILDEMASEIYELKLKKFNDVL